MFVIGKNSRIIPIGELKIEMSGERQGQGQLKKESEEDEIRGLLLGIMEGFSDNVIPPLSYFSPFVGNSNVGNGSGLRKRTSDEDAWAEGGGPIKERKRREQMNQKFSVLQSMVPALSTTCKPTQEKIISATMEYIKCLESEIQRLEGLNKYPRKEAKEAKPLLPQCAEDDPSMEVAVSNGTTFFAIQLPFRCGLVPMIVRVFEKHKAEVLEARVQVEDRRLLTFTATVKLGSDEGSDAIDKIREDILTL